MPKTTLRQRFSFTSTQKKVLFALASMVGLRMLGLFLVLPVFTLYGLRFTSSKFLVGFAFGAYALTMAILQIPLGRLSDRIGRRKVLVLGMTFFSVGSFLCALPPLFPHSWQIWELIFGRLVQGGGAIISVAFATVADYIEPERRSTAMAVLGIPIGISFAVGIIGGPILAGWFGTASLFWMTGFLGLGTDFLLVRYLKDEVREREAPAPMSQVFAHPPLVAYAGGGFLINFFMTTFFFHFPLIATGQHHLKMTQYYLLLLPMMVISAITMFGFSQGADKGWARPLAALAYLMFIPSFLLLFEPAWLGQNPSRLIPLLLAGTLFYIGFTGLEPILPSQVSKAAPGTAYGTALGFYNTAQFVGSAVGGPLAGYLANFPPDRTMFTMMVAAAIGFLMMVATKPTLSTEAARQYTSAHN
ncbi:MAG: MFS transporter [Terriglobia bacterium]|jgi:MFS family permease